MYRLYFHKILFLLSPSHFDSQSQNTKWQNGGFNNYYVVLAPNKIILEFAL